MGKKHFGNKKGVTLIELILAVSLVSLVIVISASFLIFGTKAQKMTINKYNIQSSIKRTAEKTNDIVRYSRAVFAVPKVYVKDMSSMDPNWNYLMVTSGGKKIVNMKYDNISNKHEEEILVNEQEGITYKLLFDKDESTDKMINFKIYAYANDNESILYETNIDATNTIQVVDKGTQASPSVALAYKGDGTATGEGIRQVSYVTLILDISGSMNDAPDGDRPGWRWESGRWYYLDSRINLLKTTLTKNDGIIDKFSKIDDIYISIVPFSTTANHPKTTGNIRPDSVHPIALAKEEKADLVDRVETLNAIGGTNTGDGIRRAYHLHKEFKNHEYFNDPKNKLPNYTEVSHYTILLVDGVTTYETSYVDWDLTEDSNTSYYINYNEREIKNSNYYYIFKLIPNEKWFIDDGNIGMSTYNNYRDIFKGNVAGLEPVSYTRNDSIYYYSTHFGEFRSVYGRDIVRYSPVNATNYPVITGTGRNDIDDSPYIKKIGSEITKMKNTDDRIKSYIIGYASETTEEIKYIGASIGTDLDNDIFSYSDEDFNLDDIFEAIANDILASKWLLTGPQIME